VADEFDEVVDVAAEDVTDVVTEPVHDDRRPMAEAELEEGLPALGGARPPVSPAPVLPVAQAAAVVATGFVAGAAAAALLRRRSTRRFARAGVRLGSRRRADALSIVSTRTYLVQVHVLGRHAD